MEFLSTLFSVLWLMLFFIPSRVRAELYGRLSHLTSRMPASSHFFSSCHFLAWRKLLN